MPRSLALVALALSAFAAGVATAQEKASFNVSFAGISAGTLAYEGSTNGNGYDARGSARATGLVGAFFDARVDAAATGTVTGNRYSPAIYKEITVEDGEEVSRSFRYSSGTPSVTRVPPRTKPRKHAAPAAQQSGTVDPMTAAYAILRDRPEELACDLNIVVYDGTTRARIRLDEPSPAQGGVVCEGSYTREAGFSPADMAERTAWPLTMIYAAKPDGGYQVQELRFPTSYGAARVRRR